MNVLRPLLHHVALTVTDLDASAKWYSQVFDIKPQFDVPHPGGTGRVLTDDEQKLAIVLHRHDANASEKFVETRTGLDHLGLMVSDRLELERWQDHLVDHGVERSDAADRPLTQAPIVDEFYGSVLTFRDPDNIALELFCPPPTA